MKEYIWKPYFDRFPLTDRVTHYHELVASVFVGVFIGAGLSLVSIIARRIGMSSTGITVMLTMPFVGNLTSLYFGHRVQKRRDRMAFIFWPGVTSRLAVCFTALVTTPTAFLLVMSIYFLVSTIPEPAYASVMRSNYSEGHRGRLMGNTRIVRTVVSSVLAYFAGLLLEAHPQAFRVLLPASALFGIAGSVVFRRIRIRRTTEPLPVSFRGALGAIRKDRDFVVFIGLFFLCAGPSKMAIPLEPIWFVDRLNFSYENAGLILGTVVPVMSIIGFALWAKLLRTYHPFYLLACIFILGIVRYPILALSTVPNHVIPASILGGIGGAGFELIPLFAIMHFAKERLPFYIAFHSTLVGLRGIVGPFIGNALYSGGLMSIESIFWLITGLSSAGVVLLLVFSFRYLRRNRTRGQEFVGLGVAAQRTNL